MEKKSNYQILNDYFLDLQKVKTLEDMDKFIDDISNAVYEIYPCISCQSGCFTCCTGSSLPIVYPKEWKRVRDEIKKLPEDTKLKIINKNESFFENDSELINFIHKMAIEEANLDDLKQFEKRLITEFTNKTCPFLIDNRCSVYSVRPTKCRAFGAFGFVFQNNVHLMSCNDDIKKMSEYLTEKNIKKSILPYWNYIENKIRTLTSDSSEIYPMSVIPMWIKSDIELKKFITI